MLTHKFKSMKQHKHQFSKEFLSQFKDASDLNAHFGQMFKDAVEQMLEAELDEHIGSNKHERTDEANRNYRNGYGRKTLKTDMGDIPLDVPRDREGSFDPQVVGKRQTVMDNVADTVISLYSAGMTTRDIEQKIKDIYGIQLSDSSVSRITERLLPLVAAWQNRPLQDIYLVVWIDAIHFKVRENHRVVSKALYVAIGLNNEARKEVLGFWIAQTESASFWMQVLDNLKERGVQDMLLLASDNLSGLTKAVQAIFPKVGHQLCVTHQIRNTIRYIAYRDLREFCQDLKSVYTATTRQTAEEALTQVEIKWFKYQKVLNAWRINWENLTIFFDYPAEIRRILYTTNIIENFNRMLRKYTKNRLIFPDDNALLKATYLAVQNASNVWINPVKDKNALLLQFAIAFPERFSLKF